MSRLSLIQFVAFCVVYSGMANYSFAAGEEIPVLGWKKTADGKPDLSVDTSGTTWAISGEGDLLLPENWKLDSQNMVLEVFDQNTNQVYKAKGTIKLLEGQKYTWGPIEVKDLPAKHKFSVMVITDFTDPKDKSRKFVSNTILISEKGEVEFAPKGRTK